MLFCISSIWVHTIVGDTKTAKEPSLFLDAVPTSLIVLFIVLAYSKSTSVTFEIPAVGTFFVSIDLLKKIWKKYRFFDDEKKFVVMRKINNKIFLSFFLSFFLSSSISPPLSSPSLPFYLHLLLCISVSLSHLPIS